MLNKQGYKRQRNEFEFSQLIILYIPIAIIILDKDVCPVIRNPHAHFIRRHCSESMSKIENCNCSSFVDEERLCRSIP